MLYDDDGNEINPALIPMPELCLSCEKREISGEKILCDLTRFDQRDDKKFVCHAYVNSYGVLIDDIIE